MTYDLELEARQLPPRYVCGIHSAAKGSGNSPLTYPPEIRRASRAPRCPRLWSTAFSDGMRSGIRGQRGSHQVVHANRSSQQSAEHRSPEDGSVHGAKPCSNEWGGQLQPEKIPPGKRREAGNGENNCNPKNKPEDATQGKLKPRLVAHLDLNPATKLTIRAADWERLTHLPHIYTFPSKTVFHGTLLAGIVRDENSCRPPVEVGEDLCWWLVCV